MLDAVRAHVTSSAASRGSAVKLMTDSYQFWVALLNQRVTFQSHIRFARKVQKYGDAFSKSSSIQFVIYEFEACKKCQVSFVVKYIKPVQFAQV